ncbi:MAG: CHASE2 domain-containing protein [Candidatus Accumulibacter sp.]|nr:CHASE2 domain-containing protein [Candidatus Accumulibacter conexus]
MWDEKSACSTRALFQDRVVVLGSSASYRGDWHYTPLGEMPGALILINAIRSLILHGENPSKHPLYSLAFKLLVLLPCILIWLAFWLQHYWRRRDGKPVALRARAGRICTDALALLTTVAVVLAVSYSMTFSPSGPDHSLDALLPGLTIGIEAFVEIISRLVKWLEERVATLLGWKVPH